MKDSLLDIMFARMKDDVKRLREAHRQFVARAERAEVAGAMPTSTFADRPLAADGAGNGDLLFITNGRKSGEGAGAGTGVPAYFNEATDTWKRLSDDADVAV